MKFKNRQWMQLFIGLIIVIFTIAYWLNHTPSNKKHLYLTSDIHLSSPKGRWPDKTNRYRRYIEAIENPPEIIFQIGDFVDNVVPVESGVYRGGRDHWLEEYEIYKAIHKNLTNNKVQILHSYGTGHDFWSEDSLKEAETITGIKRKGITKWGRITLAWITTWQGSFSQDGPYDPVMEIEEYEWLSQVLEKNKNIILLFHVPIKTPESIKHSEFGNGRDLTIPITDPLYEVISKYKKKIVLIVNGHIHKPLRSEYEDIPVYLCPFTPSGCICEIVQSTDDIEIKPKNCGLESEIISLITYQAPTIHASG